MKKIIVFALAMVMALSVFAACGESVSDNTKTNSDGNNNQAAATDLVKVVNIALSEEQYAFCVNQDDAELLTKVNEYLTQIQGDGTFDAICNNYFGDGEPNGVKSCELDTTKDQLVVATSTGFEPFEMVEGDTYTGIDLEIANGLATFLGKELVIQDMQFDSVVTSVQSGICDIGMAGLTVTPAREEIVTFSDSYYSANQVLLVPAENTEFDACTTKEEVEAILNSKDADCKIACQKGTTGSIYITGDANEEGGYGFIGLAVTKMEYDYAALGATAMLNGEVDYLIIDNAPANAIAKAINE